jgi:Tfp pilus tip-associated adhesin PilY1
MLAAPVRFSDVFFPGTFNRNLGSVTVTGTGVWRTVLVFGRGIAGKYYTALDVTAAGPFNTTASLDAFPRGTDTEGGPIPIWSRGNPDTADGRSTGTKNNVIGTNSDFAWFEKLGQTWSVPAVGVVKPTENITVRSSAGVESVAYTGSGYGSGANADAEGSTFYTLDMLTGDVVAAVDVGDRSPAPAGLLQNALVGSPAAFSATQLVFGQVSNSSSQTTGTSTDACGEP